MQKIFSVLLVAMALLVLLQNQSCKTKKSKDVVSDSLINVFQSDPEIKAITDQIHENNKDATLYAKRAATFKEMGKVVPAVSDITKAIELDPKNAEYYYYKVDLYLSDGYAQGAIETLQQFLSFDSENKIAITKLAKIYLYKREYDNSMAQVKRLLELDKSNFEPYFIMGLNYKEKKDTAKAISSFLEALQFNQSSYDSYVQLGLLSSSKNSNDAAQYFDNAIRLDSTKEEAYYDKAKFYQDHKQYEKAKATYKKLISLSPHYYYAFFNIGFIYLLQDSVGKAQKYFDYSIKVKADYSEAYYYRGLCKSEMGNKEQAKIDLAQCLTLDPNNDLAQSLLNTLNKN